MKQIHILLLVCVGILVWACSSKNPVTQQSTDQKSSANKSPTNTTGIKTDGTISFEAANDRYNAKGEFGDWKFTHLEMKEDKLENLEATVEIKLSSISEKNPGLTSHLKAPDFFHISKYATAQIEISNVKKKTDNQFQAAMTLNLKGLSQTLSSDFELISKNPMRIKGTAKVDRILFGLGGADLGVPKFVKVNYETEIPG